MMEGLLLNPRLSKVNNYKLYNCCISVLILPTGNRENHRRAKRDMGREAAAYRGHPYGEVRQTYSCMVHGFIALNQIILPQHIYSLFTLN